MKTWKTPIILVLCFLAAVGNSAPESPHPFVAFSLKQAEQCVRNSRVSSLVSSLGGITRPLGAVVDEEHQDVIVIGQAVPGEPSISLDDFVVALRARLKYREWPLVSIDRNTLTDETDKQSVRFEGGIADSRLGENLLKADITLKRISLGDLQAELWGVRSYLTLLAEEVQRTPTERERTTRFWFCPEASTASRPGITVVRTLDVKISAELTSANAPEEVDGLKEDVRNECAERFAATLNSAYDDLCAAFPEVAGVKPMLDLVAIAHGLETLNQQGNLEFWLQSYSVETVPTEREYPLLKRQTLITNGQGTLTVEVGGGIELRSMLERLSDEGDVEVIRDLTLRSRPDGSPLLWQIPLEEWVIPGYPDTQSRASRPNAYSDVPKGKEIGCIVTDRVFFTGGENSPKLPGPGITQFDALPTVPSVQVFDRTTPLSYSPNVGGVMLAGVAQTESGDEARVNLSDGQFSLIVGGHNARLDPEVFRKFVTALWAVYFCKEDPGISIDPIAPGCEKHLVRYIGRVVNSDLGRVMREADYLMKQWAVGTDTPAVPGFKNVDDLTVRSGLRFLGASRRFWFVPEEMRFRATDNALLFDGGRMTLKTEYNVMDLQGSAEPADRDYADFFTSHYEEIAEKYPVYGELFEYAKMVGLAKYLKEKGVPLFWFLLANKDLVLTEDSPGCVDALIRNSSNFEGIQIEGGVDLGFQGTYLYDTEALSAISEAVALVSPVSYADGGLSPEIEPVHFPDKTFYFDIANRGYSVLPQHSLTCGKDRKGIRYQTDLAARQGDLPGLEIVRYFDPEKRDQGEFGDGWKLLVPYRLNTVDDATREFANAILPERMALENQITGEKEILTFSTDRYAIAGYVPEDVTASQVLGLFMLSDMSFRLADKIGNEFWFDQAGYPTDMIFSEDHHVCLEYSSGFETDFDKAPYRIEPASGEKIEFYDVLLPEKLMVANLVYDTTELLRFSNKESVPGYYPEHPGDGSFECIALMTDGSFRAFDRKGNEIALYPSGNFSGLAIAFGSRMVKRITLGDQSVEFNYTIGPLGNCMIAGAELRNADSDQVFLVSYEYDKNGSLCRVRRPRDSSAYAGAAPEGGMALLND